MSSGIRYELYVLRPPSDTYLAPDKTPKGVSIFWTTLLDANPFLADFPTFPGSLPSLAALKFSVLSVAAFRSTSLDSSPRSRSDGIVARYISSRGPPRRVEIIDIVPSL